MSEAKATPETEAFFMPRIPRTVPAEVFEREVRELCEKLELDRDEWKATAEGGLLGTIEERDRWRDMAGRLAYRLVVLLGAQEVILGKTNGLNLSKGAANATLDEWKQMGGVMPGKEAR